MSLTVVVVACEWCGASVERYVGHVNRSRRLGLALYCGRKCAGLGRRSDTRTHEQKKADKRAYDMEYRAKNREMLREKKAAHFRRTYDPKKAAKERKKSMPRHVEYCRQPKYREYKQRYDARYHYDTRYGEWAEAARILRMLQKEIIRLAPDKYERLNALQHGIVDLERAITGLHSEIAAMRERLATKRAESDEPSPTSSHSEVSYPQVNAESVRCGWFWRFDLDGNRRVERTVAGNPDLDLPDLVGEERFGFWSTGVGALDVTATQCDSQQSPPKSKLGRMKLHGPMLAERDHRTALTLVRSRYLVARRTNAHRLDLGKALTPTGVDQPLKVKAPEYLRQPRFGADPIGALVHSANHSQDSMMRRIVQHEFQPNGDNLHVHLNSTGIWRILR